MLVLTLLGARNRSRVSALRVCVCLGSAHAANRLPRRCSRATRSESTRAGGGFPARAPTSRTSRCFAFGLDTETEINDGHTFVFPLKTANKSFCLT